MTSASSQATLIDWAWVEMMIFQAMLGVLTPDVSTIILSEEQDEWVLSFYLSEQASEEFEQDLREIAGDAAANLEQGPETEDIITTSAISKPIKSKIIYRGPTLIRDFDLRRCDRLLFSWSTNST